MKMKHEIHTDAAASAAASRETTITAVVKPGLAAEAAAEEAAAAPAAAASVSISCYFHHSIFRTALNFWGRCRTNACLGFATWVVGNTTKAKRHQLQLRVSDVHVAPYTYVKY